MITDSLCAVWYGCWLLFRLLLFDLGTRVTNLKKLLLNETLWYQCQLQPLNSTLYFGLSLQQQTNPPLRNTENYIFENLSRVYSCFFDGYFMIWIWLITLFGCRILRTPQNQLFLKQQIACANSFRCFPSQSGGAGKFASWRLRLQSKNPSKARQTGSYSKSVTKMCMFVKSQLRWKRWSLNQKLVWLIRWVKRYELVV